MVHLLSANHTIQYSFVCRHVAPIWGVINEGPVAHHFALRKMWYLPASYLRCYAIRVFCLSLKGGLSDRKLLSRTSNIFSQTCKPATEFLFDAEGKGKAEKEEDFLKARLPKQQEGC